MLQYSEILANCAFGFMITLRKLDLADCPNNIKSSADDVFTVWAFADKYARHSGVHS